MTNRLTHQPCEDCGSSDALQINPEYTYCHSCKKRRSRGKSLFTQTKRVIQPIEISPTLWSRDIPIEYKAWLYKHHFTDALITKYDLGYIDFIAIDNGYTNTIIEDRLIFPYYEDGELLYFQARSFNHYCKYLTIGNKGLFRVGFGHYTDKLIVVEDIPSAIRVGQITPCIALLGTSIKNLFEFVNLADRFIIWLDGDQAGKTAANKIRKQTSLYKPCTIIKTEKDPKCYSDAEIKEILEEII